MATLQAQFGNENQDVSQKPVVHPERKRRASIMITSKGFAQDNDAEDKAAKRRQRMSLGGSRRVSFGGEKIRLYQTDSAVLLGSPTAPLGVRQNNGARVSTEQVDSRMDMVFENADAEAEAELQTSTIKSAASPSPRRSNRMAKSLSPAKSPAQTASPYSLRPRSPAQASTPQSVASPSATLANAFGNGAFSGNSPSMSVDISMDFSAAASGNNRIKFRPLAVPASPGAMFTAADTSDIESMIQSVPMSPAAPVLDLSSRRASVNASDCSDLTMDMSLNGMELTRNFGSIVNAVQAQDASIDLPELKSLVDDDCTLPASALPSPASMAQVGKDAIRWTSSAFALSSPANSSMNMSTASDANDNESPASLQTLLDDDHTLHAVAPAVEAVNQSQDEPASLGALVDEDYTLHANTEAAPVEAAPSLGALLEDDVTLAVNKQQLSSVSPHVDNALSLSTLVNEDVTIAVPTKLSNSRFSALDASTVSDDSIEQESVSEIDETEDHASEGESDQDAELDEEDAEDEDSEVESPTDLQELVADDVTMPVAAAYRRISGNFGAMSPATAMQLGYATAAAAASPYAPYLMNMMAAAVASPATNRLSGSFFASPAAQDKPTESQSPVPLPVAMDLSQLVNEDMTLVAPSNAKSIACATPAGTLFANAFTPINAMTPSTSFSTPASTAAVTPFDSPSKRLSTSLTAESPSAQDQSVDTSTRHTVLLSRSAWEQQQNLLMQQQEEAHRRQSMDVSVAPSDESMDTSSTEVAPLQVDAPIQWSHPSMQPSTPANADVVTHSVASAFRGVSADTPAGNDASASKSIAGRPSMLNASIANGDATGDIRARMMKAEYAKILFGGNDDTTMGAFNVDNMSDQTRQLVAEHAHILAELAAAELAAAGNSTATAAPSSNLLPNMSASTLALLGVPSPAGRLATTPASRRLPTFSSSQRKQRASPAVGTPSVSMTAAMLARRMSFNAAVNDHSLTSGSGVRTQFAEPTEDDDLDMSSKQMESADETDDQQDSVAAFFRACDITINRVSVTRKSNANGFVQRDASVAPPKDARDELQRCVVEATELDINERASTRWQNVMEQLKTNIEEATQFFQQQPPPVMQMLALVPEEQRPAFGDCMRQLQQKCVAESRWQAAQRRVEDESEALNLWTQQLTSVRVDLAAANSAVSQLDRRCAEQREAHEQHTVRAAGLAAVRTARQEISATADAIEASQQSIDECETQIAEAQARLEIARVEAAEASNEVASLTEQHSYESRLRAAERAAAESARLAKIEAVAAAAQAKQALRTECMLLQAACSFVVLDEASISGDVVFEQDMTPIVALSFGDDTYRVTVLNHNNALRLHSRVYQPHETIDKSFADALLASANLDTLVSEHSSGHLLKEQLPSLLRAIDTRLGRACDLLNELVALQTEHGICLAFPTAARPTVQVALMHKGDDNSSAASITAQLQQLLLDESNTAIAPRVELEFEVSAQYPYAPLGRRLLRRVLHDETVALGDAQPERLLNRMTDSAQGFGRLTKVCLALRKRIPERY